MRFVTMGDGARLGVIDGGSVLDVTKAARLAKSKQKFTSLLELIEAGQRGLDTVRSLIETTRGLSEPGLRTDLSSAKLSAPWAGQRLVMAGANNAEHVSECFTHMGTPITPQQVRENTRKGTPGAFWAAARPLMGPGARIEIPARALGIFDYEGEPALVIGKRGKDIKAADANSYIWGVTLVIDWSIREEAWPPPPASPLALVKNFDCSKSIGPAISVGETDVDDIWVETYVNGERRQKFSSREMIFSFAEVLEYLSRDLTFYPGDVITLGTGAGTVIDSMRLNADGSWPKERFLKPGDTVEVLSPAVGSLVGHVVAKSN